MNTFCVNYSSFIYEVNIIIEIKTNYSSIGDSTVLSGAVSGGTSESIEYSGYITQGALLNIEFSQVTDASSQIVLGTEETKDEIISNP